MRDGTRLSADIYFPEAGPHGGPYPVVLHRTPYNKQRPSYVATGQYLSDHGYVFITQDVRGRHDSEGHWTPFRFEGVDGYDSVEWAAAQPWSNGKVATMGGSYSGWCQWALARERPEHLTTMVSTATSGKWFQENPYHNGCLMLVMLAWLNIAGRRVVQDPGLVDNWPEVFRHLPLVSMDERLGRRLETWREWLTHARLDDYWQSQRLDDDFRRIDIPVLHVTGWYDDDQPGSLYFYDAMSSESPRADDQHLIIGPWDHGGTRKPRQDFGGVNFGPGALMDMDDVHRAWFDRWLRDLPAAEPDSEKIRLFLTGADTWVATDSWPTSPANWATMYLHSDGQANTLTGDGRLTSQSPVGPEQADSYHYDPADPVPSVLDEEFFSPTWSEAPLDRRFQQSRSDVLVFTGDAQPEDLILLGQPRLHLFGSSNSPDTDWFIALHDVSPDAGSMLLAEGRLRARFHASLTEETLLDAGEVYEFVITLGGVGHVVKTGHRLRLSITSSDFPTWDRNPNTGHPLGQSDELRIAVNAVHHSPASPSRIELPIGSSLRSQLARRQGA
ncbi:CocE/NonD family hydrolase [Kribbella sancticallisti]|uniref:CocE/NonD family hydrolase n=1 Tax=Kribbella sancticallisti TaxID=460087 RepID=A0ABN2CMJ9_9ACTN